MKYFVTGTAGFIGHHVAKMLIEAGHEVLGIDGITPYYDIGLKRRRHQILLQNSKFVAVELMLENEDALGVAYREFKPDVVIHLAAQAGVRYSIENPRAYIDSNIIGTFNLLELARSDPPQHLLLASTSSVYGGNVKMPFKELDRTDYPLTLYAASKKATEEMAHAYSHLWQIPTTAFRFFSVYGPWGRPDMALFKFTNAIIAGEPVEIYNYGRMERDFTYIDDVARSICLLSDCIPELVTDPDAGRELGLSPAAPFRVVNIGNAKPVPLMTFVEAIETSLCRTASRVYLPMQAGDVVSTAADNHLLFRLTGFRPETPVQVGIEKFVRWFQSYYDVDHRQASARRGRYSA